MVRQQRNRSSHETNDRHEPMSLDSHLMPPLLVRMFTLRSIGIDPPFARSRTVGTHAGDVAPPTRRNRTPDRIIAVPAVVSRPGSGLVLAWFWPGSGPGSGPWL